MTAPGTAERIIPDDEQLARYLLGELAPADEAAIDDALVDEAVWDAVKRAEDDLLDAYANGELDAARRQRLADRLAGSPRLRERVRLHQDLRTVADARRRRAGWKRAGTAGVVGALAVAAALVLFIASRGGGDGVERGAETVALTLVPTTRAGGAAVVRTAGHRTLALSVAVDPEEAFPRYRVRLTAAGAALWSQDDAVAADGGIALRVPVSALVDGMHELELTGLGASGQAVRLGARSFRVVR